MGKVIQFIRKACFIEAGLADCGDGIVTGDEECDCGRDAMGRTLCKPTSCCTSECKINTLNGAQCSPQNPVRNCVDSLNTTIFVAMVITIISASVLLMTTF